MELWELLAREGIRDTVARYNSNGDTGRFAHVIDLFTSDAVMELTGATYTGLDQIITVFTGTQERVATGYVRHMTATHQIDLIDETHATGRMYFQVLTPVGLDHWGRYVDEYRLDNGRWKFSRRKVTIDGQMTNSTFPKSI